MNPHIIIEKRPRDWLVSAAVVWVECVVFVAIGYFGRPVIQAWIGG